LLGGVAAHDVARQARVLVVLDKLPGVVPREAAHVDRVMTERRIVAGQLANDVRETMAWIDRYVSIRRPEMHIAARPFGIGNVFDVVGFIGDRHEAAVVEVPEHMVERPVLEHHHDKVLDRWNAGHADDS
jgi:hypothetical protein